MVYQQFAQVYDQLMSDAPYEQWLQFLKEKVKSVQKEQQPLTILDVGCGTGTLSLILAREGFQVTGVDLSEDMLSIAQKKALEARVSIQFIQQNMTELEGFSSFDCIVVFCDSLNYLETEDEVIKTFAQIYKYLKPGGLFLFDVHSLYKVNHIFKNQTFASNEEDLSFIWHCFSGEKPNSVEHDLTFFYKEGDLYTRFDELHFQRTFSISQYKDWLMDANFIIKEIQADFVNEEIFEEAERIFFTCTKE